MGNTDFAAQKKIKVNLKKTAKKTKKKKKSRGDILADKQDFFRSQEIKIEKSKSSQSTIYTKILNYKNQLSKICLCSQNPSQTEKKKLGNQTSWKKSLPFVIQGNNTRPKKKYLARWRLMGILFSGSIIMDRVVMSKK